MMISAFSFMTDPTYTVHLTTAMKIFDGESKMTNKVCLDRIQNCGCVAGIHRFYKRFNGCKKVTLHIFIQMIYNYGNSQTHTSMSTSSINVGSIHTGLN